MAAVAKSSAKTSATAAIVEMVNVVGVVGVVGVVIATLCLSFNGMPSLSPTIETAALRALS